MPQQQQVQKKAPPVKRSSPPADAPTVSTKIARLWLRNEES